MKKIYLKNDGFIEENGQTVFLSDLKLLSRGIELEKGYRLKSYFMLLEKYASYREISDFSDTYIERFRMYDGGSLSVDSMDRLEFLKTVEMRGYPGKPAIDIYTRLKGLKGETFVELKFFQIENIIHMPLSLGKLRHVIFGDHQEILKFGLAGIQI